MTNNLFDVLRASFPADLDRVAIEVADGEELRYSWRDLDRASAMIANLLGSLGLPRGARVMAQVDKSVEGLLLYLGVLRAGLAFVPLNNAYHEAEMAYFIADAEPAVVVCSTANFQWLSRLAFTAGTAHVFTLDDARGGSLLQRAAWQPDTQAPVAVDADDVAVIIYTSGTTGRSKGAMLSHANLVANARALHALWRWRPDDVLIHVLPIFHVHGLFVAANGALLAGAKTIWFGRFEPRAVVRRLPDATLFMGVPTLYTRLLAEPGLTRDACRSMRLFVSGSAPLLIDTFDAFRERTGHTILERYGMSETVMLTSNPCDPAEGERRGGTVGRPLPGVRVRLRDDRGEAVAVGEIGGVEVAGPNVFQGYWRMPEKTAEEFAIDADGARWFRTGDVGRLGADDYLTIVGRSKDLVITGGFNVYPAEVEASLNELTGVAESAVIGVPHPDFGEAVVAVAVPRPGARLDPATLIDTLRDRIAAFKVPKRVFIADELPRNAMGKVQKNLLRDEHRDVFEASRRHLQVR